MDVWYFLSVSVSRHAAARVMGVA